VSGMKGPLLPAEDRTIVARATPDGEAGLAVVRLSGPQAVAIARRVFACKAFQERSLSHRAYLGLAVWPETPGHEEPGLQPGYAGDPRQAGDVLDEVIVLPMLAPRSYTGEDTVEFFCHGGHVPARRLVEACLAAGALAAGPGEFTRRAFLNGRLSLDQAEAVGDLIRARDDLAASAALQQLRGGLDRELEEITTPLRGLLVALEGSLEFSEDEDIEVPREELLHILSLAQGRIEVLLALARAGRHLREGVQVVLVGAPNVGKSSLLNALTGEERVIVDHEAGTTRDVVSVPVSRPEGRFVLNDTAGLREEGNRVERLGMERTRKAIATADIVLQLREAGERDIDASAPQPELQDADPDRTPSGAVILHVLTKADRLTDTERERVMAGHQDIITSAVDGSGLQDLWKRLEKIAGLEDMKKAAELGVYLNERHQHRLMYCLGDLKGLLRACEDSRAGDEVVASLLASILTGLEEISGRVFTEHLLDDVFSRFCVGK
jgi:tRNA modification GTPase